MKQTIPPHVRLTAAREAQGLSQYAVAKSAGVHHRTVKTIEEGHDCHLSVFTAIAGALGLQLTLTAKPKAKTTGGSNV